ncbi:MAG: hypothetical protein AAGJ38_00315 [Planctomycetota bacterium]
MNLAGVVLFEQLPVRFAAVEVVIVGRGVSDEAGDPTQSQVNACRYIIQAHVTEDSEAWHSGVKNDFSLTFGNSSSIEGDSSLVVTDSPLVGGKFLLLYRDPPWGEDDLYFDKEDLSLVKKSLFLTMGKPFSITEDLSLAKEGLPAFKDNLF